MNTLINATERSAIAERMTPAEHALARSRTYALIAEILIDGWTPRALGVARQMPWADALAGLSGDALAARHHAVFGRGVSPHASVFVSDDGLLGGAEAAWFADWSARAGVRSRADVEPDHAGSIASALGWLEAARSDALRDGASTASIDALEREALARLGWLGWLSVAVDAQGAAELSEIAGLFAEITREHGACDPAPGAVERVLDDPAHGLKDLAAYLLVPARCGLWLGPEDLRRLSASADVPCGFGRRLQMAESLLFSAVDHGALPALAAAVDAEITRWDAALGPDRRREATSDALHTLARSAPPLES